MNSEIEFYLPSKEQDGTPVASAVLEGIKAELKERFGGYTCMSQRNEGAWKVGEVTFFDEVTLVRVITEELAASEIASLKENLQAKLNQKSVLIVKRHVEVL